MTLWRTTTAVMNSQHRKIIHLAETYVAVFINMVTMADKKPATPTAIAIDERLNIFSCIVWLTKSFLWSRFVAFMNLMLIPIKYP